MTTHINEANNYPARFPLKEDFLACEEADRTYAEDDVVKGPKIAKGVKITDAIVASDELDSNGAPTMTGTLRLNNGTTQQNLVTVSAVSFGAAGGQVTRLNVPDGFNFVVPADGYWLEFVVDAAVATAASGRLAFGVAITNNLWGSELP